MSIILQLCLPILVPFPPERELLDLHTQTINELEHFRQALPINSYLGGTIINLQVRESPEQEALLSGRWKSKFQRRSYSLLNVSIDATKCIEKMKNSSDLKQFSDDEIEFFCREHAASVLELEAQYLLLAANISRPGSLSVVDGYAFFNGEYFRGTKSFLAEDLVFTVQASRDKGWPKMVFPSLKETWKWLVGSECLVDGVGVGRLGRALSAFSHLTTSNNLERNSIELAWILLGLESLYARGNVGLKEQLLGKTETILGPRTENKKLFGAVYDFRSRLIHGDVDIPVRFTEFDAVEKYESFHAERYEHEALAGAVLVATLHWMIRQEKYSLDFEYAVKHKPEPESHEIK